MLVPRGNVGRGLAVGAAAAAAAGGLQFGQELVRQALQHAGREAVNRVLRHRGRDEPDVDAAGGGGAAPPPPPGRRRVGPAPAPGPGPAAVPPAARGRPPVVPSFLPVFEPARGANLREYLPVHRPLVAYNVCRYVLAFPSYIARWINGSRAMPLFAHSYPLVFAHSEDATAVSLAGPMIFAPQRGTKSNERLGAAIGALFLRISLCVTAHWSAGPGSTLVSKYFLVTGGAESPYSPDVSDTASFLFLVTSDSSPSEYDPFKYSVPFFEYDGRAYSGIDSLVEEFVAERVPSQERSADFQLPSATCLSPVVPACYSIVHAEVLVVNRPKDYQASLQSVSSSHVTHDLPIPSTLVADDSPVGGPFVGFCGPPLRFHLVPLVPSPPVPIDVSGCASLVFAP